MALDAWPSSAGFDLIADALKDDAQKQDAIKKGGNIFAFTLKNDQGKEESWHIDLKETGTVGKGLAPQGKKPGGKSPNLEGQGHIKGLVRWWYRHQRSVNTDPVSFSYPGTLRCRIRKAHLGQGQRPEHVHARQAEDQGQHDGGDQAWSHLGEGPE